jgi:HAD superfamily hydrolase (TIGR01450 family)
VPSLLDRYDAFLLDLDGVLVRGDRAIPTAPAAVAAIRAAGRGLAFMRNNSARTPPEVAGRLRGMGIDADAAEVATSAAPTARLLSGRGCRSAFVVGEEGIRRALDEAGIEIRDGEPDQVDAVVVGWDRSADYAKLRTASILVDRGAALVATNADPSFPASEDIRWPGAGALLAAITTTMGVAPEIVGKPNPPLYRAARALAGGGRPLVVGDRLDTDVAGAARLGWDSLLVLSGIARRGDVDGAPARPTYVAEDLSALTAPETPEGGRDAAVS